MIFEASKYTLKHCPRFQGRHLLRSRVIYGRFALRSVTTKSGVFDDRSFTSFNTLHELQESSCTQYSDNDLFGTYNSHIGHYQYMTYEEYGNLVNRCRVLLKTLGVKEFDKVAIISNNRWEWAVIAAAVYSLNGTFVPMYEAQLPGDWAYILNDSQSSVLFCATQEIFDKVHKEVIPSCNGINATLCLDALEGEAHAFATAMAGIKHDFSKDRELICPPNGEDLANLIYTSGTTGSPKGVELSHINITSNIKAAGREMVDDPKSLLQETDRSLAFLPWAHSYGQTCELWMAMSMGSGMAISRGISSLLDDMQLVKPSILFAVPTLYKKVYDAVHNLAETGDSRQATLLKKALMLGRLHAKFQAGQRGPLGFLEQVQFSILNRLVLSKIRSRFGGNLRYGCVAGAACPPEVLEFMDSIGIPICEGYGLTETSPIITLNVPQERLIGSVGRPIPGVTVHIVDEEGNPLPPGEEGEICCTGPNVMRGYYNNAKATSDVLSIAPDGKSRMFHTGDLGRLDEDGWLRVTGRIKEQYKLENGKYVVPAPIEAAIGMSRFISQVVLYGANRPYNVALIVPEWAAIRTELNVGKDVPEEDLVNDERMNLLIGEEIHDSCYKMKKFEIPTKWAFVAPFTAANNMLTPKMSIRKHKVIETYEDVISRLYGDDPRCEDVIENQAAQAA